MVYKVDIIQQMNIYVCTKIEEDTNVCTKIEEDRNVTASANKQQVDKQQPHSLMGATVNL